MTPRVSVVLPYRNAESTLESAIRSILNQTFTDFELLLVDNASTDESFQIAQSFEDSRIRHFHELRKGVVYAANLGLEKSVGEFIARMDADDLSEPGRLKVQVALLENQNDIGLVSGLVEPLGDPKEGFRAYLNWVNGVIEPAQVYQNQFVEYPIVNPSIVFRRSYVNQLGVYKEGDFPEDYEYFLRLITAGVRMMKVDEVVLRWNDLPSRLTRTSTAYSEDAFNRLKSEYLASWLEANNSYHPKVWVWGAGKQARSKSQELTNYGINIRGYIDVSGKSHSGKLPVIHFEDIPTSPDRFILSYVGNRGARDEIRTFLTRRGWKEMQDFVLAG